MKSLPSVFLFLLVHLHGDEALNCEAEGGACHQAVEHVDIDLDHTVGLLQAKLELTDRPQGVAPASRQARAAYPSESIDRPQGVAPASRQAKAADPTELSDRHRRVSLASRQARGTHPSELSERPHGVATASRQPKAADRTGDISKKKLENMTAAQAVHAVAHGQRAAASTVQQNARLTSSKMREAKMHYWDRSSSGVNIWWIVLMFIAGAIILSQGLYNLRSKPPTTNEQAVQVDEKPVDLTTSVARSCRTLYELRTPPPASREQAAFNIPGWAIFQILCGLFTISVGVYFLAHR